MYRKGHYGVSLLTFAPVGAGLVLRGDAALAVLVGAGMLWLAMLPDVDHRLPGVSHRGVTHTVAFALLVGIVLGVAGVGLGRVLGLWGPNVLGVVGFGVGFLGVVSHLLGDALTPAGIRPLWPLSRRKVTLSLTRADDTAANYALFAAGAFVTVGWVFLLAGGLL